MFLRQWPEGPQAEPEDIAEARRAHDAIFKAAEELDADSPTMEHRTPEQLADYIRSGVERLADRETDSATKYVLKMRINVATSLLYGFYARASEKNS